MPLVSELVGQKGTYSLLNKVYKRREIIPSIEINDLVEEAGVSDNLLFELVSSGILTESADGFYLSSVGRKVTLLLRALNEDEDMGDVFRQLTYLYPSLRPYELITESTTDYFIDGLYARPDFLRICICSPWIRLDEQHMQKIRTAVGRASKQYSNLQILVITLPLSRYRDIKATETVRALRQLGADIVVNSRLHAKLYISEPGPYGGHHYAIFGSENLTGRGNIELAIKIESDNEILKRLNLYFSDIWQNSEILKEAST